MIKPYYKITLRDYNLMEKTGEMSQFYTTKLVPGKLLIRLAKKEIDKARESLNQHQDIDNEDLVWEVTSLTKINLIEANYLGVMNLLGLGSTIKSYKREMVRRDRRKIRFTDDNLSIYIGNLEQFTGIKINIYSDLDKVFNDLVFRKDKFKENFGNKPQGDEGPKVYLLAVALGVFSYLDQPIDLNMTIVEFSLLREEAGKKLLNTKNKD